MYKHKMSHLNKNIYKIKTNFSSNNVLGITLQDSSFNRSVWIVTNDPSSQVTG